jgi:hypothetical protein
MQRPERKVPVPDGASMKKLKGYLFEEFPFSQQPVAWCAPGIKVQGQSQRHEELQARININGDIHRHILAFMRGSVVRTTDHQAA